MPHTQRTARALVVFLVALPLLVHCLAPAASQTQQPIGGGARKQQHPSPQVHYGTQGLPAPVREMREALLAAVQSGQIEELGYAYELNDLKPDLGAAPGTDPVAHWRRISGDGHGREVLAALWLVLDAGYVVLPLGPDLENNRLYVWPYLAEVPLGKLTPAQEVELLRLVLPGQARQMKEKGRYTHWRLAIGADGSWHTFRRSD